MANDKNSNNLYDPQKMKADQEFYLNEYRKYQQMPMTNEMKQINEIAKQTIEKGKQNR